MNFHEFKVVVSKQLDKMTKGGNTLYSSKVSKDVLWDTYLSSFPAGSNPMYLERTEHDCNCCKSFIRAAGGILAYVDGKLTSIWDIKIDNDYQVVSDALSSSAKDAGISTIYLHEQSHVGNLANNVINEDGSVRTYNHFHYVLPATAVDKEGRAKRRGEAVSYYSSLELAVTQIDAGDVAIVQDLIAQDMIHKGPEYKKTVDTLARLISEYNSTDDKAKFLWTESVKLGHFSTLRNGPIGTLLTNMGKGDSLEVAVKKYEDMVSGTNFKRSKTLATPRMVEEAYKRVQELGLEDALPRRFSVIEDMTINNVLFADHTAKVSMGVFDSLGSATKKSAPNLANVDEVTIGHFMENILPKATSIELMVENSHQGNFMSLIAPVHANSGKLFKWDNTFSWAYNGDVTDASLREQVRLAGGSVDGDFRFSHSWNHDGNNQSLMDLHVFMPGSNKTFNGTKNDSYGNSHQRVGWNCRKHSASGGSQDVDFTERAGTRVPVENITFPSKGKLKDGVYTCAIHNWSFRSPTLSGFHAEIEIMGQVFTYEYKKPLDHKEWVVVAEVTLKNGVFTIDHKLPHGAVTKETWGIQTNQFVKVDTIMLSPNFWDDQEIGHKHYFFMLEGCKNPESARGFYTEFLRDELHQDRKVFEMLGAKLKAEHTDNQLSGLGFSSTRRNSVTCKVRGSFNRTIKINF